jgi:hypothetical protein
MNIRVRLALALACLVVSIVLVITGTVMGTRHSLRMRASTNTVAAYTRAGLPAPQAALDKMLATGMDPTGIYIIMAGAAVAMVGKVLAR